MNLPLFGSCYASAVVPTRPTTATAVHTERITFLPYWFFTGLIVPIKATIASRSAAVILAYQS